MNARERILSRLRAVTPDLPPSAAIHGGAPMTTSPDERLARFSLEATALGIECHVEVTADDVRARVAGLVADRQVLSWNPEHLPYGLGRVTTHAILGSAPRHAQASADVGLTGCDAAIAETGSLVLFSGPGRSRAVSLLPPVHIAVVRRDLLCFAMAEVFASHAARFDDSAACTIITGPSRTADIELTLTLGIHGPGRVIVIIGP
jgi:L-lactate dehydrogenase complex protein LldG